LDSPQDLANCSLVCRGWLPQPRRYLFAEVVCDSIFLDLIQSSHTSSPSAINLHISKITFDPICSSLDDADFNSIPTDLAFPRLAELRLTNSYWTVPKLSPLFQIFASSFAKIDHLHFSNVTFGSFSDLVQTMHHFPSIQSLTCNSVDWEDPSHVWTPTSRPHCFESLRRLTCAFTSIETLLKWFGTDSTTADDFPALSSVSLTEVLQSEMKIIGAFLSNHAAGLEHLEIGFLGTDSREDNGNYSPHYGFAFGTQFRFLDTVCYINLQDHTHLKSVSIRGIDLFRFPIFDFQSPGYPPTITDRSIYGWIPSFLSTIPSDNFEKVTLHIWCSTETQLEFMDWPRIAEGLETRGLAMQLRIVVAGVGLHEDGFKQWLQKRVGALKHTAIDFAFA